MSEFALGTENSTFKVQLLTWRSRVATEKANASVIGFGNCIPGAQDGYVLITEHIRQLEIQ